MYQRLKQTAINKEVLKKTQLAPYLSAPLGGQIPVYAILDNLDTNKQPAITESAPLSAEFVQAIGPADNAASWFIETENIVQSQSDYIATAGSNNVITLDGSATIIQDIARLDDRLHFTEDPSGVFQTTAFTEEKRNSIPIIQTQIGDIGNVLANWAPIGQDIAELQQTDVSITAYLSVSGLAAAQTSLSFLSETLADIEQACDSAQMTISLSGGISTVPSILEVSGALLNIQTQQEQIRTDVASAEQSLDVQTGIRINLSGAVSSFLSQINDISDAVHFEGTKSYLSDCISVSGGDTRLSTGLQVNTTASGSTIYSGLAIRQTVSGQPVGLFMNPVIQSTATYQNPKPAPSLINTAIIGQNNQSTISGQPIVVTNGDSSRGIRVVTRPTSTNTAMEIWPDLQLSGGLNGGGSVNASAFNVQTADIGTSFALQTPFSVQNVALQSSGDASLCILDCSTTQTFMLSNPSLVQGNFGIQLKNIKSDSLTKEQNIRLYYTTSGGYGNAITVSGTSLPVSFTSISNDRSFYDVAEQVLQLYMTSAPYVLSDVNLFSQIIPASISMELLVVAGGGGGAWEAYGGGGGAGGMIIDSTTLSSRTLAKAVNYQVTVGIGGSPDVSGGVTGRNSIFTFSNIPLTLNASGGGGGGRGNNSNVLHNAKSGGSGGGGSAIINNDGPPRLGYNIFGQTISGGDGIVGQGFSGGKGNILTTANNNFVSSGGGGGAGGVGGIGDSGGFFGGHGGPAKKWDIDSMYYAGGGGGGTRVNESTPSPGTDQGGRGGGFSVSLTSVITSLQSDLSLSSTSGILAGYILSISAERMLVTNVMSSNSLRVSRAYNGSVSGGYTTDLPVYIELGGRAQPKIAGTQFNNIVHDQIGLAGFPNTGSGGGGASIDGSGANGIVKCWVPYLLSPKINSSNNVTISVDRFVYNSIVGTMYTFTATSSSVNGTASWYI